MAMEWVGEVLLVVHNRSTPRDEDWSRYLDHCLEQYAMVSDPGRRPRQLVVTHGGAPNLAQRRMAHARAGGGDLPVAVVSSSGFVRFVANVLVATATNSGVRAFATLDEGCAFLGVEDRALVARRVEALSTTLDATPVRRAAIWGDHGRKHPARRER